MMRALLLFCLLLVQSTLAQAQNPQGSGGGLGDADVSWEVGGHLGNLLPDQVEGVTEITPQWGVRGGFRASSITFIEFGGQAGKGHGADWRNLHVSLRMGVPIETMMGVVFLGGDVTQYQAEGREQKLFGGGHVGGGIMAPIGGFTWFRTDMKFNVNPGTSLYIGAGLMFRL